MNRQKDIKIHSGLSHEDIEGMREVYHSVGWTKHTNQIIKQIFHTSQVKMLFIGNQQVIAGLSPAKEVFRS